MLEHVAGGFAFRPPRRSRGLRRLSRAAGRAGPHPGGARDAGHHRLHGSLHRPEIARIRGVSPTPPSRASSARPHRRVGRDGEFGAVRYATTPLFERVFELESLARFPVDDVGADAATIRSAETVAEKRPA